MPAMTSSVAIFMLGLSLGAFWFRSRPNRLFTCLTVYGLLESFLGLYALILPFALKLGIWQDLALALPQLSLINGTSFSLLNFLAPFLLLFLPTCAMGATFPLAFKLYRKAGYTKDIFLYALNIAGAILGLLASQAVLLPNLGFSQTNLFTASLNLACGFILIFAAWIARNNKIPSYTEELPPNQPLTALTFQPNNTSKMLLASVAVASFCSLSLEISLSRLFILCFGSTLRTYTAVLACILLGLLAGCLLSGQLFNRNKSQELNSPKLKPLPPATIFAALFVTTSINLLLVLYFADRIPWLGFNLGSIIEPHNWLAPGLVLTSIIFIVPPSLLLGTILPASLSLDPRHPGKLYAVSTFAGVIGTLITGYFLLPGLSLFLNNAIQKCALLVAFLLSAFAFALALKSKPKSVMTGISLLSALCSLTFLVTQRLPWPAHALSGGIYAMEGLPSLANGFLSFDKYLKGLGVKNKNNQLLFYKDGLEATVSVTELKDQNLLLLKDNGKVEAAVFVGQLISIYPYLPTQTSSLPPLSPGLRPANLSTQALLGYAPHLVRPNFKCDNAFVIGYGSGVTTGALLKANKPNSCTVCEIEPVQLEAKKYFSNSNELALQNQYLRDRKLIFQSVDARFALKSANTNFDLIVSQPSEPWLLGSADLFTKEFFQLVHSRLSQQGIFCQWLQLYGLTSEEFKLLLETFKSSFEHSTVIYDPSTAEIILAGSRSPLETFIPTPHLIASENYLIAPQKTLYNTDDNLTIEYRHKIVVDANELQNLIKSNLLILNQLFKKPSN